MRLAVKNKYKTGCYRVVLAGNDQSYHELNQFLLAASKAV
jgi:hypothetical protein